MATQETHSVDWSNIELLVKLVSMRVPRKEYKAIYGVPRGGLIPAAMLAYQLDIRRVGSTVDVTSIADDYPYIVVDDILDTGKTYKQLQKRFPHATFAFLINKGGTTFGGKTFFGTAGNSKTWYVFPWAPGDEIGSGKTPI